MSIWSSDGDDECAAYYAAQRKDSTMTATPDLRALAERLEGVARQATGTVTTAASTERGLSYKLETDLAGATYLAALNPHTVLTEIVPALRLAVERTWQPIETFDEADGECDAVLVSAECCVGEAVYRGAEDGWWWINNDPTDAHGERIFPDHWMPLPAPPARLEGEK